MKNLLRLSLITLLLISCNTNSSVKGTYKSVKDASIFSKISFDGEVASFTGDGFANLMPSAKYKVKNDKIYIEMDGYVLTLKIIDSKTIEGTSSILKGMKFKKQ